MVRILFIDDNVAWLEQVRIYLADMEPAWQAAYVTNGEQGLELLLRQDFDIVVADHQMPGGMDGIALFTLMARRYPNIVRLLLSGVSPDEISMRALGTAHQWLGKPCALPQLRSVLKRAILVSGFLQNGQIQRLISQIQSLPSFPPLYTDLLHELRRDQPSVSRIGQIVSRDMGMCTKILQLANSALFGRSQNVASPEDAVIYLGLEKIKSLVLYLHIIALFERVKIPHFSFDVLWGHCCRVAVRARMIAELEEMGRAWAEQAFVAGLLHDVGKLVMGTGMPTQFETCVRLQWEKKSLPREAEWQVLATTHAEVGGYLLGLWGLPEAVVEAVTFHHHPADCLRASLGLPDVVHVANALEREKIGEAPDLDLDRLRALGLEHRLEAWRGEPGV